MKSPYLVTRHEIYVDTDEFVQEIESKQHRIRFKPMPQFKAQSTKDRVINLAIWLGVICFCWGIWYGVALAIDKGF